MTRIFSVQVHAMNVDCTECSSLHDLALLSLQVTELCCDTAYRKRMLRR